MKEGRERKWGREGERDINRDREKQIEKEKRNYLFKKNNFQIYECFVIQIFIAYVKSAGSFTVIIPQICTVYIEQVFYSIVFP
jgi:hypothetical protein